MFNASAFRARRLAAGLTQVQAAVAVGISQQYLADVENGKRSPSLEWTLAAAAALGWNPCDLDARFAAIRDTAPPRAKAKRPARPGRRRLP
jgi:transcriptional regulator with XRE-family HTH domain